MCYDRSLLVAVENQGKEGEQVKEGERVKHSKARALLWL